MAYRKTEKVLASIEARRASILAAAIDIIAKSGMDAMTTDAIAARAEVAVGLIYKYFPDKTELLAQVVAQLLRRDLEAIRAASEGKRPMDALATALAVFYTGFRRPHLVHALGQELNYRSGIQREFSRLIAPVYPEAGRYGVSIAAAAALGALYGAFEVKAGSKDERAPEAVLFALRGIGIADGVARRAIERTFEEA